MALLQFCNSVPEFFHSNVVLKLITRLSMKANSLQYCICNKQKFSHPLLFHTLLQKSYLEFLQERPSHMHTSLQRYMSLSTFVKLTLLFTIQSDPFSHTYHGGHDACAVICIWMLHKDDYTVILISTYCRRKIKCNPPLTRSLSLSFINSSFLSPFSSLRLLQLTCSCTLTPSSLVKTNLITAKVVYVSKM